MSVPNVTSFHIVLLLEGTNWFLQTRTCGEWGWEHSIKKWMWQLGPSMQTNICGHHPYYNARQSKVKAGWLAQAVETATGIVVTLVRSSTGREKQTTDTGLRAKHGYWGHGSSSYKHSNAMFLDKQFTCLLSLSSSIIGKALYLKGSFWQQKSHLVKLLMV